MNSTANRTPGLLLLLSVFLAVLAVATQAWWLRIFPLADGSLLVVWPSRLLWWGQPLFWLLGLGLPFLVWRTSSSAPSGVLRFLAPLSLLALYLPVLSLRGRVPDEVVAMAVFFIPALILAWTCARCSPAEPAEGDRAMKLWPVLLVGWLAYTATGLYFTETIGAHSGDEGNYILMAQSLYEDGDLDVENQFVAKHGRTKAERYKPNFISPFGREGRWIPFYAYGLSLLLAPLVPLGEVGRHLLLGLIAAGTLCGVAALGRSLAVPRRALGLVLALMGATVYFVVYASRCLPEMLGALFITWLVYFILHQRRHPVAMVVPAALCVAYPPFCHPRFLPVALMGMGLYGLVGLWGDEPWRRKLPRLAVFTVLCLAGQALYWWNQFRLFEGGLAYANAGEFFALPWGAWAILACERGMITVLPVVFWLLAANLAVLLRDPGGRPLAALAFALFIVTILTSAMSRHYAGGATMPGRFLLVTLPLLVPCAARWFSRSGPVARAWFGWLAGISIAYTLFLLWGLARFQKGFATPLRNLPEVFEVFRGLMSPHIYFLHPEATALGIALSSVFAAALFALTLWLVLSRAPSRPGIVVALIVLSVLGTWGDRVNRISPSAREPVPPKALARALAGINLDHARALRIGSGEELPWLEQADAFRGYPWTGVTSEDLGQLRLGRWVSQPRLPVNDWADRGYRWMTLNEPSPPGEGKRMLFMKGWVEGDAPAHLAIRQGSRTLLEEPVETGPDGHFVLERLVRTRESQSSLYVLVRVEAEGRIMVEELKWAPYRERFLREAGMRLSGTMNDE